MATILSVINAVNAAADNRKAFARLRLRTLRDWYAASNDPLHVWTAYAVCNESGIKPPDWVHEYLVRVASNMASLKPRHGRFPPQLKKAMEFKGDPFKRRDKLLERRAVIWWLLDKIAKDLKSAEDVELGSLNPYFLNAEAKFDVPRTTISEWWDELAIKMVKE